MKKRILIVTSLFPNKINPVNGIFVYNQVQFLKKSLCINVISPIPWVPKLLGLNRAKEYSSNPNFEELNKIPVFYPRFLIFPKQILFPFIWVFYLLTVWKTMRNVKGKFNFDIIHTHFAYPDGFAIVLLAFLSKKPVILTVHGSDINIYTKHLLLRFQILFSLNRCYEIIAVSEELKNKIIQMGISPDKIKVIPMGFDSTKFKPLDTLETRKNMGLPQNSKILLFVGNLIEVKGLPYLINAMWYVSQERQDIVLFIVGDGDRKKDVQSLIHRRGLEKYVKLIGQRPFLEIPMWVNSADALVLPSLNEGTPTILLEALACGKPFVASKVGGIPNLAVGKSCELVPTCDSLALSKAILTLIDKKFEKEKLILSVQNLTSEECAKKVSSIYESY